MRWCAVGVTAVPMDDSAWKFDPYRGGMSLCNAVEQEHHRHMRHFPLGDMDGGQIRLCVLRVGNIVNRNDGNGAPDTGLLP